MTSTDRPDGPNQADGTEAPRRRRDLRNEAAFMPQAEAVEDLADLHRRLVEAGQSAQVARGIVSWLVLKAIGEDRTGPATRSRYRKILAELPALAPPPERPERSLKIVAGEGKGTRRRARGGGKLASVVALAIASAGVGTGVPSSTSARAATGADQVIRVVQKPEAGNSDVLSS